MLHVHRAERADGLVAALGELLADAPADPFAAEVVAVPTRGMERWLSQQLSLRLGICANVAFPSPGTLAREAVAVASGVDPAADPWLPERAVWPLLEVVEAALGEPWLETLAHYLGPEAHKRQRRLGVVRHLAGLLDKYALYRPELVEGWAAGADGGWQAELWRRLRAAIGTPGPAERRTAACARLRAEPGVVDLPERLAVFGLTRLPAGRLEVLQALAHGRDVHLLLLHPSPGLWARLPRPAPVGPRAADPTAELAHNRLLASWGRDARELGLVVTAGEHADHHHPVPARADTLLGRLQADVREDREPDAPAPPVPGDRSVEVHACHGRARQVEVLRDAILHLLADDPTLEPRDVIVMCPDVEAFAPLIQATFGAGAVQEGEPAPDRLPDLRVRLADRSLRQTNPVLGVVGRLLELAGERLSASQVLDLADREPVRRRFGLDDDALARVEAWVGDSGVRWGLDAAHRAPFRLDAFADGTWRRGLDRVLAGVTMTEDERLVGDVLPLEDVESGAVDLAGRLAELVARLHAAVDGFVAQPVAGWAAAIAGAADALTATTPGDAWQRAELGRLLDDLAAEAGDSDAPLGLAEIRALVADRIAGRPTRANFRTGALTVCTLVPMRSVPHRVVCLLGLDDGAFPRKAPRDGDDLTLSAPHVGDRDPRSEDRQQLLDALLAARDKLLITYTGNDERTNAVRPPAVPVGELLDAVARTVAIDRDAIVVRHPLQAFDPRNFRAGALVPGRPWGFDRVVLDGARRLLGDRPPPPAFLPRALPPAAAPALAVEDLVGFTSHPVRAFLRHRLGISVADYTQDVADALPVELDNLEQWAVGDRLLRDLLRGATPAAARRAEEARGALPPGALGALPLQRALPMVAAIAEQAGGVMAGLPAPASLDLRHTLPDGRVLGGTVPDLCGDLLTTVTYSRVGPRQRLRAWVQLLALTVAHPERPFSAVIVGRAASGGGGTVLRLPAVGPIAAQEHLAALVDLYDRALLAPPPLACKTSAALAERGDALARREWETGFGDAFDKEDRDPEHVLVHGGVVDFDALLAPATPTDEDWGFGEPARFASWARRLWTPLLAAEAAA